MDNVYWQQGDCLIYKLEKLPSGLLPRKGSTLALGEVTGHHHSLYEDESSTIIKHDHKDDKSNGAVQLYEDKDKSLFAEIIRPVWLKHNEHKPIAFTPGVYRIGIVREYDHVEKLSRKVVD